MSNYNTQLQSIGEDLQQVIQTLQNKAAGGEQATPEIEVNNSTGLITATAGTKSSTYQLAFQAAKTITPGATSQIAVSSGYYTGGNITVAGDSNLVSENIKSGVSIFGVSGTLEEDSGSSEIVEYSENEDAIVSGTITSYTNDRVTSIDQYTFYGCRSLTSVSFLACESIASSAFNKCSNLTTALFPMCTYIEQYAFANCSNLTTISFPECKSVRNYAFAYCSNLTTISFPECQSLDNYAFAYCSNLTTISFPKCERINDDTFTNCSNLTTISFPKCWLIGYYAFARCYQLKTALFFSCRTIGSYAFVNCRVLSSLVLHYSYVCTLSNSNAFSSTPYAGYSSYFSGTPYIYVPASLVDAYKSATNWTYFSSYFSSIESLGNNSITFTIDGTEYQAEEGMTWAEWVESAYNTDEFICNGNIQDATGRDVWLDTDLQSPVIGTDIIINNYNYFII